MDPIAHLVRQALRGSVRCWHPPAAAGRGAGEAEDHRATPARSCSDVARRRPPHVPRSVSRSRRLSRRRGERASAVQQRSAVSTSTRGAVDQPRLRTGLHPEPRHRPDGTASPPESRRARTQPGPPAVRPPAPPPVALRRPTPTGLLTERDPLLPPGSSWIVPAGPDVVDEPVSSWSVPAVPTVPRNGGPSVRVDSAGHRQRTSGRRERGATAPPSTRPTRSRAGSTHPTGPVPDDLVDALGHLDRERSAMPTVYIDDYAIGHPRSRT